MTARTSPETRLALLSAGTAGVREASRSEATALIDDLDWAELAGQLRSSRLLPLLGERIVTLADDRAPVRFTTAVQVAINDATRRDAYLELITIQLLDALIGAGVPALAVKGPTLGRALYGGPGRRPSGDIDLLVGRDMLGAAVGIAARFGYRRLDPVPRKDDLPRLHVRLEHEHGQPMPQLEIHWRLHWYEADFSSDLLDRSAADREVSARPIPLDEFASLLLFYARDGFSNLRQACDIAAWWDRFATELEPWAIEETIFRYPALDRVLRAAVAVIERVVGIPSDRLLSPRPLEPRVKLATLLANPQGRGAAQQQAADAWLVDWLLTPRGGRRDCIRRQLKAPAGHDLRLLRRYVLSLLRVARTVDT